MAKLHYFFVQNSEIEKILLFYFDGNVVKYCTYYGIVSMCI